MGNLKGYEKGRNKELLFRAINRCHFIRKDTIRKPQEVIDVPTTPQCSMVGKTPNGAQMKHFDEEILTQRIDNIQDPMGWIIIFRFG